MRKLKLCIDCEQEDWCFRIKMMVRLESRWYSESAQGLILSCWSDFTQ